MSKIRSRFIELGDPFDFTDSLTHNGVQVADINYVGTEVNSVPVYTEEELSYSDTVNKVIQLSNPVYTFDQVTVFIIGGTALDYGIDYTVRSIGAQAYLCISPLSQSPGAPFDGGSPTNPSAGIDRIEAGDRFRVLYNVTAADLGGISGSVLTVRGPQGPQGVANLPVNALGLLKNDGNGNLSWNYYNVVTVSDTTTGPDAAQANVFNVNLAVSSTLGLPRNMQNGQMIIIRVNNTGNNTLGFATGYKFIGSAPVMTSNGIDLLTITRIANEYYCTAQQNFQ